MKEAIYNAIERWFGSIDIYINGAVNELTEWFWYEGSPWISTANAIRGVIQPIAVTICAICFLIEFIKISLKMDMFKWEFALKVLVKFVIARACMDFAMNVMLAIYTTGWEWTTAILPGGSTAGADAWFAIKDTVKGYGMWTMLGFAICNILPLIAIWIISQLIKVIAIARKFEMVVWLSVVPLPCAFLPLEDHTLSHIPVKYVLNWAALCIHSVFMVVCIKLYGTWTAAELNVPGGIAPEDAIGQMLVATLVLIMAISKSSSWAKALMNAS